MTRIRPTLVVAFALLLAVTWTGPTAGGPSTKAPPFKAGTSWTYKHTAEGPAGENQSGTMTEVFGGQATYRGRTFYYVDQTYTRLPGFKERVYLEWVGTHFRQVANVATDAQGNMAEIIMDRPIDLGVAVNMSGTAVVFQNGEQKGTAPMTYSASSRGTVKVTVPAGTFQATKWKALLKLGQIETAMTIYTVGITDIQMESKVYASGSLTGTRSRQLINGPVR